MGNRLLIDGVGQGLNMKRGHTRKVDFRRYREIGGQPQSRPKNMQTIITPDYTESRVAKARSHFHRTPTSARYARAASVAQAGELNARQGGRDADQEPGGPRLAHARGGWRRLQPMQRTGFWVPRSQFPGAPGAGLSTGCTRRAACSHAPSTPRPLGAETASRTGSDGGRKPDLVRRACTECASRPSADVHMW